MKYIIKLTIILTTFTLVSCGEKTVENRQSSQPEQPILTATKSGTSKNPFALNRLAKQTVVEIVSESFLTGGDKYIPEGSGVIIGRKDSTYYVLTANHISDIDDGLSVFIRSEKPGEAGEVLPLKFIKRYPREDLAVVAFASLTDYEVAEVGEASLLDDDNQVYVAGWPGAENRQGFQFTPAKVTNPRAGNNLNYQPTEPGEDVYQGMSGGAVLNEAGQLVGIHVGLTRVGGDGEGVLISTFLREVSPEVEEVLVRGTPVATIENEVVENVDNVTPSQIKDAESYYDRGAKHYKQGEYEKALADFNQAIQLNPKLAKAYNDRGIVYRKQGKYEKAIADYNQAIQINPEDADYYNNRGIVYKKQGEYEKALADYSQAIQLNPEYHYAYYNRGIAYDDLGEYEKALADYNQAIQINPEDADYYNNRGIVYKKQGEYEKALADYNQAIQINPEDADYYNGRGNVYSDQGEYEKALADYNQAIQLNPKYHHAYNSRGLVYYNQRKYEKALANYNQAIQLNPKYSSPYYNRGLIHKRNKNTEKAISDFEKAAELHKQEGDKKWYQNSLDKLKELRGN
ncbi:MAG: tetratricopeptide repeat protein [Okeania sp. SIO3I5]|uniref:tetratricopeptide repeat protein n=1 Tax=Okeania sp. SIO3I5 TaxID=2607805 RepID=UPI0013BADD48|nr:serine protease [Okeania sp. SIO3I5]NEQ35854.1 tetratricopeptide repeat protein [Okeania sp. SIO3I5]